MKKSRKKSPTPIGKKGEYILQSYIPDRYETICGQILTYGGTINLPSGESVFWYYPSGRKHFKLPVLPKGFDPQS